MKVDGLTPKEIVAELDRYIVSQGDAKKAKEIVERIVASAKKRAVILPLALLRLGFIFDSSGKGKDAIQVLRSDTDTVVVN